MKIYVIHENDEWLPPFRSALDAEGVPYEEWFLDGGTIDVSSPPPEGVFWSRMSASSHTRGHAAAKEHTRAVLSWLEAHGRRTVNGRRVVELEMSKVDQLTALQSFGLEVPRTLAVVGDEDLPAAARRLGVTPFITKHNQGGKGLGVRRYDTYEAFDASVADGELESPVDHITLLQEYVAAPEPFITRVEIVGGEFLYALAAGTGGGFELCPADACEVDTFRHRAGFDDPIVERYLAFARHWGIEVAGFEFIEHPDGRKLTYDINTNTNYNTTVERQAGRSGPRAIARYLSQLLYEQRGRLAA